ncbi:hypothetical protein KM043_006096 [Ampulex compressa]|nr:hypothetical protein KM043_006096 [Ampulex compressa]
MRPGQDPPRLEEAEEAPTGRWHPSGIPKFAAKKFLGREKARLPDSVTLRVTPDMPSQPLGNFSGNRPKRFPRSPPRSRAPNPRISPIARGPCGEGRRKFERGPGLSRKRPGGERPRGRFYLRIRYALECARTKPSEEPATDENVTRADLVISRRGQGASTSTPASYVRDSPGENRPVPNTKAATPVAIESVPVSSSRLPERTSKWDA